jgi:hypothetical protein
MGRKCSLKRHKKSIRKRTDSPVNIHEQSVHEEYIHERSVHEEYIHERSVHEEYIHERSVHPVGTYPRCVLQPSKDWNTSTFPFTCTHPHVGTYPRCVLKKKRARMSYITRN